MALIRLVKVKKTFDEITALDGIDLSVKDGEYVCILGQTGAGKTTLLRIIAGLTQPDEGEIYIDGELVNDVPPEERNAVYMFQQFALFPHMNVLQNISFGPEAKDLETKRIESITFGILEMVRLTDRQDALPNELSGGMQQRVALARGIASGAKILLLDEPLGALDARLRVDLRRQLRKLVKEQGLTAIHVTHDQEEALMTADRIIILRRGKIEQIGAPQDIYSKPKSIFVTNFVGGANFIDGNIAKIENSNSIVEIRGGLYIHVTDTTREIGQRVVLAIRMEDVTIEPAKISRPRINCFDATIDSVTFVGGSINFEVRFRNDMTVVSKILFSNVKKDYKIGEHIIVSFPSDRFYIFPYPRVGLLKEIEAV